MVKGKMTKEEGTHVLISYVKENTKEVDKLCKALENYGVNIWRDIHKIKSGSFWLDSIRKAIKEGAYFIACFSKESYKKDKSYMREEVLIAIEEMRLRKPHEPWFIPVLLSKCTIPPLEVLPNRTLQDIQYVELYKDWDASIQKILDIIKPVDIHIKKLIKVYENNKDEVNRANAIRDLGKTVSFSHISIIILLKALIDKNSFISSLAEEELNKAGRAIVPDLIKALKSNNSALQYKAIKLLGRINDLPKYAIHELKQASKKGDLKVRGEAIKTLGNSKKATKDVVSLLVRLLRDENKIIRTSASDALGNLRESSIEIIEALRRRLFDSCWEVHDAAYYALKKIGTPEALKALKNAEKIRLELDLFYDQDFEF